MVGSLFDETPGFDREHLADRLSQLAAQGVYIGGSSWKYEGWLGQIYTRSRYHSRGRFSKKLFEATCLEEYAETFPAVCGDFAFYQFPAPEFWQKLMGQVPDRFRFAFKVPEQITCKLYPSHARYGPLGGAENEFFLNADLLYEMFLKPLLPYREKAALLIFEFGTFSKKAFENVEQFVEHLSPFLAKLPPELRYAVEIRNPEFLERPYFDCLRERRVAHVYNAWSRMPELRRQMQIPESVTADFLVCRALLRYGRPYEQAVQMFSPYTEVRDVNEGARDSLRVLINRAREERHLAFLFVNNRLEGNAPATVLSVVD